MPGRLVQLTSQRNANSATAPNLPPTMQANPGFIAGAIESTLSSIPELFGAAPSPIAQQFRAQNPVSGFISEIAGMAVPYAGWAGAAAKIPSLGRLVSAGRAAFVGDAAAVAASPIKTGVYNMAALTLPVEASRLAVGTVVAEDYGELFGDVLISSAFGLGLGAVGGMLRKGGSAIMRRDPTEARGVSMYAHPSLHLQQLVEQGDGALVNPELGLDAAKRQLANTIFSETPLTSKIKNVEGETKRAESIFKLEGSTPEEMAWVNSILQTVGGGKAARGDATKSGLLRRSMMEGPEDSLTTLNPGQREVLAKEAGFADDIDLASAGQFHREITVVDKVGAGRLNSRVAQSSAWQRVGDSWIAKEADEGLHVVLKKLPSKAAAEAAETAPKKGGKKGPFQPGDRYLMVKTNRPDRFFPEQEALRQANYASWAKYRQAFQPPVFASDPGNMIDNRILSQMSDLDYRDIQIMSRKKWLDNKTAQLAQRMTGDATAKGSQTAREVAEGLYDAFAPTMYKQGKGGLWGRFEGTMRARVRHVTEQKNRMIYGSSKIKGSIWSNIGKKGIEEGPNGTMASALYSIPDDEWGVFLKAATSGTPGEKLAELAADGVVSQKTMDAVKMFQALDKEFLERNVYPMLDTINERGGFKALDFYLPQVHYGPNRMYLYEGDKVVRILSGKSVQSMKAQAQVYIDTAAENGRTWVARGKVTHELEHGDDPVDKIFEEVSRRMGQDEVGVKIIRDAMKKMNFVHAGSGRASIPIQTPGMFKVRSGLVEVTDLPTKQEVLKALDAHYQQLGNFAMLHGWSERWGSELTRFSNVDRRGFEDLMRIRNQHLGIEGKLTNALNKTLQPILGPLLGTKPATKIAAGVNQTMWAMNLGIVNPAFALLNALSPIMTVLPHMAYTLRASRPRMENMLQTIAPAYDSAGRPVGTAAVLEPLKFFRQAFTDMRRPPDDLKAILNRLVDDGTLTGGQMDEFIGAAARGPNGLKESFKEGGFVKYMYDSSTWMARKSEEFARVFSANSGYRLGKDALGLEGDKLLDFTRRFVENTNYLYGVTDRPRVFTGPLGSIFGLFKNWQFHYLGMMSQYAGLAWKENVYSPLLWQTASALAIGGLGATPLRHMADGLAAWYGSDKDGYRWMLEEWGAGTSDNIWYGLPSFLGISLQSSSAMPGTDVRNDIASLGNMVAIERAKQIGKAVGAINERYQATGEIQIEDPNLRDQLLQAISPRALHRVMSTVEGDYVRSMGTGYPTVRGLTPAQRMLHATGFNELDIARHQTVANELFKDNTRMRSAIQQLGASYAQGMVSGSSDHMQDVINRAVLMNIPVDKVMSSARTRYRREVEGTSFTRYGEEAAVESEQLLAGEP